MSSRLDETGALKSSAPAAPAIQTFRSSLRLLANRRFGTFWFASLLSSIGTWAQTVAEPWLLLTLGASSFLIGLDSFAATAPMWLLTLFGGALADRADRRRVIAFFQSIQMLCPIAIVGLLLAGRIRPWMVIVLSVVVGVTDALSMPSFQSIVPSIVRREEIASGLALNSTQFNLSRILASFGAGGLLGAAALLGVGPHVDRRRLSSYFAIGYGGVVVVTAFTPWFWAVPGLFVLAGAAMTISNTSANALLQASASPHLLGRTVSLYMIAMSSGISIGAVLTGATVSADVASGVRRPTGRRRVSAGPRSTTPDGSHA